MQRPTCVQDVVGMGGAKQGGGLGWRGMAQKEGSGQVLGPTHPAGLQGGSKVTCSLRLSLVTSSPALSSFSALPGGLPEK